MLVYEKGIPFDDLLRLVQKEPLTIKDPGKYKNKKVQKKLIGEQFYKDSVTLPIANVKMDNMAIDMQFAAFFRELWTEELKMEAKKIVHMITDTKTSVTQINVAPSGTGKTSLVFALSHEVYMIFITAYSAAHYENRKHVVDASFQKFGEILRSIKAQSEMQLMGRIDIYIHIFIAARLIYLIILLKKEKKLTPLKFLMYQLNGSQKAAVEIYELLWEKLNAVDYNYARELTDACVDYLREMKLNYPIGIAIDEANAAAKDETLGE